MEHVLKTLAHLESGLIEEMLAKGQLLTIPAHQQIVREGQYIKHIPIVMQGLLKVIASAGEKELLLYYIQQGGSCIMSFAFSLSNEPSNISAFTETDTEILLLDADDVRQWLKKYPSLNTLFLDLYNQRYRDLVDTISELIYAKLDTRIYHYLCDRAKATSTNLLTITHREIADDLASSREVVTRMIRKLETDNKIRQTDKGIQIL